MYLSIYLSILYMFVFTTLFTFVNTFLNCLWSTGWFNWVKLRKIVALWNNKNFSLPILWISFAYTFYWLREKCQNSDEREQEFNSKIFFDSNYFVFRQVKQLIVDYKMPCTKLLAFLVPASFLVRPWLLSYVWYKKVSSFVMKWIKIEISSRYLPDIHIIKIYKIYFCSMTNIYSFHFNYWIFCSSQKVQGIS